MKKSIYFPFLITLLIVSLHSSCEQTDIEASSNDLTLQEVQEVYQEKQKIITNSKTGRKHGINWDCAVKKKLKTQEGFAFAIPLKDVKGLYISGSDSTKKWAVQSTSFAFAYKNNDKIQLELVQPIPTTNSEKFTGHVIISDWNNEAKAIHYYKNGQLIEDNHNNSGRISDISCTTTHYYECVTVSIDEIYYDSRCTYTGSTTTCIADNASESLNPDEYLDLGDSGGGGGDSSSASSEEENLCTNPLDPTQYVPCENIIICPLGMTLGPNGECVDDDQAYANVICPDSFVFTNTGSGFTTQINGVSQYFVYLISHPWGIERREAWFG